jgi:hypothetical protein
MNPAPPKPSPDKTKIVVYTAISNQYNALLNPKHIDPSVDYFCFTDQPLWHKLNTNTAWKILPFPDPSLDPVRKCRMVKMLPHRFFPEYDYSVWVDGSINIIDDVRALIKQYDHPPMLCFKHPIRSCIYQEGQTCIDVGKDDPSTITKQLTYYKEQGFPEESGLIESNALIRRHNDPNVVKVMEDWWKEVKTHSRRDQLSFPYVIWRNNFSPTIMGDDNVWGSSAVFSLRMRTRHGNNKFTLWDKLCTLTNTHILWRFKHHR